MTKSVILETFNNISTSESILDAYNFLFSEVGTDKSILLGISDNTALFEKTEFGVFLINSPNILENILSSDLWDEFLFWLIQSPNLQSPEVFEKIAETSPDKFISSIRFTQGFLISVVYEILVNINLPSNFENHQKIWKVLYKNDTELWNQISSDVKDWNNGPTEHFLGNLINWLEIKRFEYPSNERLELLSKSYSFIISCYLSEYYEKTLNLNLNKVDKSFLNSFEKMDSNLFQSFEYILEYIWVQQTILIPYSYDHNIEPIFNSDALDFKYKNEQALIDWRKDGERYDLNNLRYSKKITDHLQHNISPEEKKILNQKNQKDQEDYLMYIINFRKAELLLKDLHLSKLRINRQNYNTLEILNPIMGYSFNRKLRYEYELEQFRPTSNSWQWSYLQLVELSRKKDVDCYPFFFMSKEEYIEHNIQANNTEQKNIYEELINQFGYRITERFKFNRHSLGYDVWYTPFVLLGEMLFCPMMFFASNEWFYTIAQIVIKNYDRNPSLRKPSSVEMEKCLLERFKSLNPKWNCFIPEFKHDGDIDLIVSDGSTDILLQLKRTYFRTNLKDAYFESIRSDRKAFSQLIQGEKFIEENNLYSFSENRLKWLVSTSFENVNQVFEDCRKVNYLDLIWILDNKEFKTIQELNSYIMNDSILDETPLK